MRSDGNDRLETLIAVLFVILTLILAAWLGGLAVRLAPSTIHRQS